MRNKTARAAAPIVLCCCLAAACTAVAAEQTPASFAVPAAPAHDPAANDDALKPVVVEMFLSQSCDLSPPAADYMNALAAEPGVVALAWHVDYWNVFAGKKAGRWQDPFSRASYADRQRRYNKTIRDRSTVFTPQAVIDGRESIVGSKRDLLQAKIAEARALRPGDADVVIAPDTDGLLRAQVTGAPENHDILLVSFYSDPVTDVKGGANAGMKFNEANVVTDVKPLARAATGEASYSFPPPAPGMGCAVLVQAPDQGGVAAARYCPAQ